MGSLLGGPGGQNSKQKIPEWARAFANWGFAGRTPGGPLNPNADFPQQGPFYDAIMGAMAASPEQLFGGLADKIAGAQQAGSIGRDLMAQSTNQGWHNAMRYGNQANDSTNQSQWLSSLIPESLSGAMRSLNGANRDAQNWTNAGAQQQAAYTDRGYADQNALTQQGLAQAMQGIASANDVRGASGAGQQVVDAALSSARQMPAEAYQRVVADALPEVRSSYSARGLGTGGESARGEQEYVQRTRDKLYQQDVANQIAALGTAANASGAAASQAIGAQNAAIARGQLGVDAGQLGVAAGQQAGQFGLSAGQQAGQLGVNVGQLLGQLGLQSSQAPGQILQQMQGVNGSSLDALTSALGLQAGPGQLAQQGMEGYARGLNLPLQYQQDIYNLTRDGGKGLLNALAGQQQSVSKSDYRGVLGIKK